MNKKEHQKAFLKMVNYVKYIKRAAGIIAGFIIFAGMTQMLNAMFVDDSAEWNRVLWHDFYEDQGKIDHLYLGSSNVFRDVDPRILDQMSGAYHFNLSTGRQKLKSSYYLLREADRLNDLSHVYLEMYYDVNLEDDGEYVDYNRHWQNTDYMRLSFNKMAYIAAIKGPEQYINILLPFSRYRSCLGDWDYIREQIEEKRQEEYLNYGYRDGDAVSAGQGFREGTGVYKENQKFFEQRSVLSGYSMQGEPEKYCRMIIEYCQSREIPITLFVSPIYDLQLISTLAYDDYVEEVRTLADEYGVAFYDFNLAKEAYFSLENGEGFMDSGHLNKYGAEVFTPFLYEVVSGKETDNDKYFYASYKEKLEKTPPAIYGIYCFDVREDRRRWIASNRDSGMEYRIVVKPVEGGMYVLRDFDENKQFELPAEEEGLCVIEARMRSFPDEIVQTMEISF